MVSLEWNSKVRFFVLLGVFLLAAAFILYYMEIVESTLSQGLYTKLVDTYSKLDRVDYLNSTPSNPITTLTTKIEDMAPKRPLQKVIVYWSTGGWYKGNMAGHNGMCGRCPIVRNRSLLTHPDTAAVIFPFESNTFEDYPKNNPRRAEQLYVWWTVESPSITRPVHQKKKLNLRDIGDYYLNGTMTCRLDSLIRAFVSNPIQKAQAKNFPTERNITRLLAKKTKSAVWFVSNCKSGSNGARRLRLSDDLIRNGLAVDRFGGCFKNRDTTPKRNSNEFFDQIEGYYFYLAFENSLHCRGYITEKFFNNGLQAGAVPIVSGATKADYATLAPPHSYIHVEDFNSTKELVDYLHYLERNKTAYAEYFAWRTLNPKDYYPYGRYGGFCALCRALYGIPVNDTRTFTEIYGAGGERYDPKVGFPFRARLKSLHDWWYGTASEDCLKVDTAKSKRHLT